ncbi:hypothetical protein M9979_07030 [Sphingomonas sp. RP10(2022)]|uniref:DUF2796 domain-containing protein n=1 Tax=Sphingomonas liriopis TaxID=2949094 RepID=A0A9X2HYW0_9SPHN|nr:DUF6702 family protein [Sphingomonas liriopis]MCP3734625.1 hypothetical protein [Sphingomonas liriopis]
MRIAALTAALTVALLSLAAPAAAHRGHSTLSVIEVDAATGAVTVTHDMAAHDAEPALVFIAPNAQPSLDDADALAALTVYIGRRFRLSDATGAAIALTLAATELDGDDVRLTYRGRMPAAARAITVDSTIFADIHPDQENQVNVRRSKVTRTALFRPGSEPQTIALQ